MPCVSSGIMSQPSPSASTPPPSVTAQTKRGSGTTVRSHPQASAPTPEAPHPTSTLSRSQRLTQRRSTQRKHRKRWLRALGSALFYLALAAVLVIAFISVPGGASSRTGARPIWGFFFYEVLTDSMQSTIPQGSLAIVREVNPADIEVGDNISFFMDTNFKVTHQVIGIIEDYEGTGQRGFETKGTDNSSADPDITYAGNVIGRVVSHLPGYRDVLTFVRTRWYVAAAPVVGVVLIIALAWTVFGGRNDSSNSSNRSDQDASEGFCENHLREGALGEGAGA